MQQVGKGLQQLGAELAVGRQAALALIALDRLAQLLGRRTVIGALVVAELAERALGQALADGFQPDPASGPASLTAMLKGASPQQLALAQRALGKLGYYKGPDDGAASQQLGEAIQNFQRERGLAANGQLSPELVQTFAHIAQ